MPISCRPSIASKLTARKSILVLTVKACSVAAAVNWNTQIMSRISGMVILRNLIRSFKYAGSLTAPAPSAAAMCIEHGTSR